MPEHMDNPRIGRRNAGNSIPGASIKTLILEASGQMRFSWKSEQAISHFLQPLHLERSRAIHNGVFSEATL
jgi:hypothetical protein